MKKLALEETTNTHQVKARGITVVYEQGSTCLIQISGPGIVTHGEHGTIQTEVPYVAKYVQKELNPVTQKIEDAND